MKFRLMLFVLSVCSSLPILAQIGSPYSWEEKRTRYVLTDKEKKFAEYELKHHFQYDFSWDKNNNLSMLETSHSIILVTNSESIQRHNKLEIYLREGAELVVLKARSINKNGKVVLFDQSNLKEVKDEQNGSSNRIFAFEGIETESELEYFYTIRKKGFVFETLFVQAETPVKEITLSLTTPKNLFYEFKLYHDTAQVKKDTLDHHRRYRIAIRDIPGVSNEGFAANTANRKRLEIKLAYNTSRSASRVNTWADAAKSFYRTVIESDGKDDKGLDKFIKTINDNPAAKLEDRIRNVEEWVKNSIQIIEDSSDPALGSVADILTRKQASKEGYTRLFTRIFTKLKIDYRLVVTCDRSKAKFDSSFDTWAYLDNYLIYFPGVDQFISTESDELRYPLVESEYTAQKGLFIEPVQIGEIKSALASVREIPASPPEYNVNNLDITVSFSDDNTSNDIVLKGDITGYEAYGILKYFGVLTEDQKKKLAEGLLEGTASDAKIKSYTLTPSVKNNIAHFSYVVNFTSESFIESAGNNILFKAGLLIGAQTELYSEDDRRSDIENTFKHGYVRKIHINLPKNFKVTNPGSLNISATYTNAGKTPYGFNSKYTQKDNAIDVMIDEYYNDIYLSKNHYEEFRKVVNASADFNKVTLVLDGSK